MIDLDGKSRLDDQRQTKVVEFDDELAIHGRVSHTDVQQCGVRWDPIIPNGINQSLQSSCSMRR